MAVTFIIEGVETSRGPTNKAAASWSLAEKARRDLPLGRCEARPMFLELSEEGLVIGQCPDSAPCRRIETSCEFDYGCGAAKRPPNIVNRTVRRFAVRSTTRQESATAMEIAATCLPGTPRKRRSKKATRPQLLMRDQLDGRTNAAKAFDRLVAEIEVDLAGRDQLTAIERALVEAFAGSYVSLCHLNAQQLALGQPIDLSQHAQCVGAMVRVASRLGLQRRQRTVLPTLSDYLASRYPGDADDEAAAESEAGSS
jgi:hypothetical protein